MIQALIALIGQYTPLEYATYVFNEITETYELIVLPIQGIAGVNFPWVFSAAFVLLTVYCLFRFMYGLLFGGGKR